MAEIYSVAAGGAWESALADHSRGCWCKWSSTCTARQWCAADARALRQVGRPAHDDRGRAELLGGEKRLRELSLTGYRCMHRYRRGFRARGRNGGNRCWNRRRRWVRGGSNGGTSSTSERNDADDQGGESFTRLYPLPESTRSLPFVHGSIFFCFCRCGAGGYHRPSVASHHPGRPGMTTPMSAGSSGARGARSAKGATGPSGACRRRVTWS